MVEGVKVNICRELTCQSSNRDSHIGRPFGFKGINEGIPNLKHFLVGDCFPYFGFQYPVVDTRIVFAYIALKNINFFSALIRNGLCAAKKSLQPINGVMCSLSNAASITIVNKLLLETFAYDVHKRMMDNSVPKGRSVYRPALYFLDTLKLEIGLKF